MRGLLEEGAKETDVGDAAFGVPYANHTDHFIGGTPWAASPTPRPVAGSTR